ncbi:hypothetical protein WOLCODRAFT_144713 [Wolfiporia cocos MD-104 SS10]|uniref:Mtf2-like C-terminal domain-containing protein n=1 Tax=Wolfiporia cocos (strain MD-104) TaxID=742152 RepID=A0A2H3JPL5_WOLCO|nr:hypothetical protein WOLCODRAFT_144713 [Wolfiporia cocos MD-104 SS10]
MQQNQRSLVNNLPPLHQGSDDSIFSPTKSPWDHVFEDINDLPPLMPSQARTRSPLPQTPGNRAPRRVGMTAREIRAFDDMFDLIFSAVAEDTQPGKGRTLSPAVTIGRALQHNDLFGRLRRDSRATRWTRAEDEQLDEKKEQMELCESDAQLLEWAMREVFDESRRYEENARRVLEDPKAAQEPVQLQPPWYPQLLSLLMSTFRDKYNDPHLALSIFDHARHMSIPSFVFGCTTLAYNELIETRWRCFRDLRGVCDALEEMRVNGVYMNNRTYELAETIRHEVGRRNFWQEESTLGGGQVWEMIAKIERLAARESTKSERTGPQPKSSLKKFSSKQLTWTGRALKNDDGDGWEFGRWDDPTRDVLAHAFTTREPPPPSPDDQYHQPSAGS